METSASLLERLKRPDQGDAWIRFVELYTPLLYHWARRRIGLSGDEAADLIQEVFTLLVQKLPEFRYDKDKSFRGWLRLVMLNKWRESQRRRIIPTVPAGSDAADVPISDQIEALGEKEYQQYLVRRALTLMQAEFQPATWKACWEYVVAGKPVAQVADELGITPNAVYLAKSRVLSRLRQELNGLFD
jgi:RNA polymerase sigma-70 factor (ECF subfamily)